MRSDRNMNLAAWRTRVLLPALALVAALLAPSIAGSQSNATRFRLIVHPDNPVQELSRAEVDKVFLKRRPKWGDGLPVKPVNQPVSAPVRESFSKEVHKRSASMVRNFWQTEIYSGRGVPPLERGSDEEIVAFVAGNRGAIGYVSLNANVGAVKVVEFTR